jgi:hypothetical protein
MKRALSICCLSFLFSFCTLNAQIGSNDVEDNSELAPGENADEKIRRNFFLRSEVSKTECFVGEPLMAVFKAYSRLEANSQVRKRPSLSGFSVIEMVDAYNNLPEVEKFNGANYNVHLIRKVQLFPLQAGTFTIEPAEVESVIYLKRSGRPFGRIRRFFRKDEEAGNLRKQVVFRSPPVTIQVNPLPEKGQPEGYSGAVGDFLVQMQMPDTIINEREPAVVKVVVSGTGNFPLVTEPHISWPLSAEVSGPTIQEQVNKYAYPLSGFKSYQFSIEHRDSGRFSIPAVRLSFFDPKSKKYKVAESNILSYHVANNGSAPQKKPNELIFRYENQTPLHYYYFGVIVLIILSLIIYFIVKPSKKAP